MNVQVDAHRHEDGALASRLARILDEMHRLPGFTPLRRIAVALYDERRDMLCSFGHAGQDDAVLDRHEYALSEVPSLAILAGGDQPRIIDDLGCYGRDFSPHTAALRLAGFRSSLTIPVHDGDRLQAFIFYNAVVTGFFRPDVVGLLHSLSADLVEMVRVHCPRT